MGLRARRLQRHETERRQREYELRCLMGEPPSRAAQILPGRRPQLTVLEGGKPARATVYTFGSKRAS